MAVGKQIICPYCFHSFYEDEVLFRATCGWTQDEIDEAASEGRLSGERRQFMELFRRFDDEENPDEVLVQFWRSRGGSGYRRGQWDYPHIDPKDAERFRRMTVTGTKGPWTTDSEGFVRDSDGFIIRVVDRGPNYTKPMARLCPGCHNPLPLSDYGKYPVIFIGVVGITSAGKTVYLMQLLNGFARAIAKSGYTLGASNLKEIQGENNERVEKGYPLPAATDDRTVRHPMAANILREGSSSRGYTIVFYDIAGENCVTRLENGQVIPNDAAGLFIAHSDGLMLLIDPAQVDVFAPVTAAGREVRAVSDVVDNVQLLRTTLNPKNPRWDRIPVAAVLTKSDRLRGRLPSDSLIFRNTTQTNGFNREEFLEIHQKLKESFEANTGALWDCLAAFPMKGFFAVSAITCGVCSRFTDRKVDYVLSEQSERAFRRAREYIQMWNSRTPEERRAIEDLEWPVAREDGSPIRIAPEESVNAQNASFPTNVTAERLLDGRILHLTLAQIQGINLVSYPAGEPRPRRVEDPLRWILWRKGVIGPWFYEDAYPRKKMLESDRRYEQRCAEVDRSNQAGRQQFYEGEAPS